MKFCRNFISTVLLYTGIFGARLQLILFLILNSLKLMVQKRQVIINRSKTNERETEVQLSFYLNHKVQITNS